MHIHRLRLEICTTKTSLAGGRGSAGPLNPLLVGSLLGRPRSDPGQTKTQSTPQDSHRHVNERATGVLGLLSDGLWQWPIGSKKTKHIRFLEGVVDLDVRALAANRGGTIYSLASAGGPLTPEPLPAPLTPGLQPRPHGRLEGCCCCTCFPRCDADSYDDAF